MKQTMKQIQDEDHVLLGSETASLGSDQIQLPSDAASYLQRQNPQPHHCKNLKTEMSDMCCVTLVELVATIISTIIPFVDSIPSPTHTNPTLLISAPIPPHSFCRL